MMKTTGFAPNAAVLPAFTGRAAPPKAGTLAGGKSHSVPFGANKIHYVTVGGGKHTLVFVHCWAGNLGFWREQVPALADQARLVFIDLPGHGQSDKQPAACTMDYFAGAVLAVMRDARVDKATLIGHSMGGPVIYCVYKQAPEKAAALVVVDGFLRRPRVAPAEAERFIAQFRTPEYREHTRRFFGAMFPVPGTEALRDRVLSEMLATPQSVILAAMEGMLGPDQPDWDLKKVDVPLLVINAKGSMWDADCENHVRSLSPQTDYRVMEGVGHWLMLERPAEFNALLTDMLRKFDLIAA
ncbi:MAG: alpha/beta hydrolase [Verrucomicrobiota bacterium]|jgi:pimeloyl-ACP methyl ester carboxylesterase